MNISQKKVIKSRRIQLTKYRKALLTTPRKTLLTMHHWIILAMHRRTPHKCLLPSLIITFTTIPCFHIVTETHSCRVTHICSGHSFGVSVFASTIATVLRKFMWTEPPIGWWTKNYEIVGKYLETGNYFCPSIWNLLGGFYFNISLY